MVISKYDKILELLRQLEKKYNSICNAPENDPTLKKLQKTASSLPVSKREAGYIRRLVSLGFSAEEIAKMTRQNIRTVWSICDLYELKLKRPFHYILRSPDGKTIYVESLAAFVHKIFKIDNTIGRKILIRRGWKILTKKTHWSNVPLRAYYHVSYLDRVVKKNGKNSYIYRSKEAVED